MAAVESPGQAGAAAGEQPPTGEVQQPVIPAAGAKSGGEAAAGAGAAGAGAGDAGKPAESTPDVRALLAGLDFENENAIADLLAVNPKLSTFVEKGRADAVNRDRQKTQRDNARRAVSLEAVTADVDRILAGNADPNRKKEALSNAFANTLTGARDAIVHALYEGPFKTLEIATEDREAALEAWFTQVDPDDPNERDFDRWLSTTVDGAAKAKVGKLTLKDIPETSALHTDVEREINERVATKVAAELKAKGITVAGVNAPKPGPQGAGGEGRAPVTLAEAKKFTDDDWGRFSTEERNDILAMIAKSRTSAGA